MTLCWDLLFEKVRVLQESDVKDLRARAHTHTRTHVRAHAVVQCFPVVFEVSFSTISSVDQVHKHPKKQQGTENPLAFVHTPNHGKCSHAHLFISFPTKYPRFTSAFK